MERVTCTASRCVAACHSNYNHINVMHMFYFLIWRSNILHFDVSLRSLTLQRRVIQRLTSGLLLPNKHAYLDLHKFQINHETIPSSSYVIRHDEQGKAVPPRAMVALGGRKGVLILNLGTKWGWVVSVTPRPRFAPRKVPPVPLYRRLGGPQSRSGHRG
jgi:hypothetical protein